MPNHKIEDLPELAGLAAEFGNVHSRYGFKVIEVGGKKMWTAATFEDFKKAEASRLGIDESAVSNAGYNCSLQGVGCVGNCGGGLAACEFFYESGVAYCACR
jgi:hypothetical protein